MKCDLSQEVLTRSTGNLSSDDYLNKLWQGCLTTSSTDLVHYVPRSFAILDCIYYWIPNCLRENLVNVLNCENTYPDAFLCNNHKDVWSRVHIIITNIYFNNKQKNLVDLVQTNSVKDFKQKQRKRQKTHYRFFISCKHLLKKLWEDNLMKVCFVNCQFLRIFIWDCFVMLFELI